MAKHEKVNDAAYIAAHPQEFGIVWVYTDLNKGKDQKTLLRASVPQIECDTSEEGFAVFAENFPATVVMSINGTSAKVKGQNNVRTLLGNDPKATNDEIKQHIVRTVLQGVVMRSGGGTRIVYIGADGQKYTSADLAAASYVTAPVPTSTELAAALMADLIDAGVDAAQARTVAARKYPDAFPQA